MMPTPRSIFRAAVVVAVLARAPLGAQAYAYPALQPAQIVQREYNFALADAGSGGTSLVFQWREGLANPKLQFTMDAGFADAGGGASTVLFLGGGVGQQLATAGPDMPFDVLLTGGLGLAFADGVNSLRLPVGASVGHRFPLEGGYAVSPYVHPRLSWNRVSSGGASSNDTQLEVDIGANFEIKPQMGVRLSAVLGDSDAVGISFVWIPRALK